jgi:hypothetical protein
MSARRSWAILGLGLLFMAAGWPGCGPVAHDGDPDAAVGADGTVLIDSTLPHTLSAIMVTPTNTILEVDLNSPTSQAFMATGHYLDGVNEDLTDQVTWQAQNPAVGSFAAASLEIPGFAAAGAEVSLITATLGQIAGEAQITVVAYRQTGTQTDFFFILPYEDPAGNVDKPLDFSTDVPALDAFFLMDTTGSMFGEITNLQNALTGTVIPGIQAQIPNAEFGAGAYEDFPVDTYGNLLGSDCGRGGLPIPDQPFKLFQTITSNLTDVQTGVGNFSTATGPIGCGNDWPEAAIEGMYQVATGTGLTGPGATNVPANSVGIGGVGFRVGTMPVVIPITDAMSHALGENTICTSTFESVNYTGTVAGVAHTRQQTKDVLNDICAKVVGIASIETSLATVCTGQADLEDFSTATGARVPPEAWDVGTRPAGCATGQCCTDFNGTGRVPDVDGLCPLVFRVDSDGSGLGNHIVTGIQMLTRFATFDVTTERDGETQSTAGAPLPTGTTTADFIQSITPIGFQLPPPPPNLPDPTFDAVSFQGVTPGTVVSFDVSAYNDFVPQTNEAQIFRAVIRVLAGGCTDLDQRTVFILVPPNPVVVD